MLLLSSSSLLKAAVGVTCGLILAAAGFWMRQTEVRERATMIETRGTVVGSVREPFDKGRADSPGLFAPVIEFGLEGAGSAGRARFTGRFERYQLSIGQPVVVRYDAAAPQETAHAVDALEGLTSLLVIAMGAASAVLSLARGDS